MVFIALNILSHVMLISLCGTIINRREWGKRKKLTQCPYMNLCKILLSCALGVRWCLYKKWRTNMIGREEWMSLIGNHTMGWDCSKVHSAAQVALQNVISIYSNEEAEQQRRITRKSWEWGSIIMWVSMQVLPSFNKTGSLKEDEVVHYLLPDSIRFAWL